jgi:hypothetical protein
MIHNPIFWVVVVAVVVIIAIAVRSFRKSETSEMVGFGESLKETPDSK